MTRASQPEATRQRAIHGTRLRTLRLKANITMRTAAKAASVAEGTWRGWEQGTDAYRSFRAPAIAAAIGVPVAQLFTDELVLAEIRVSDETLERVRKHGRGEAQAAAERIARSLEPLIWEAASRKPVDVAPGVRAKRRRTRAEVLAGVNEANRMRTAATERKKTIE